MQTRWDGEIPEAAAAAASKVSTGSEDWETRKAHHSTPRQSTSRPATITFRVRARRDERAGRECAPVVDTREAEKGQQPVGSYPR